MFESNYLTMLMKPTYEKPVDTAQDILDRGLTIVWPPGTDSFGVDSDRIIIAKVIF